MTEVFRVEVEPIPRPKSIDAMLYDVTSQSPDDPKPVVVAKFNAREDARDYASRLVERLTRPGRRVEWSGTLLMPTYEVIWERQIEADNPVEAAEKALDSLRAEAPDKGVSKFLVNDREIDPWNPPYCSAQVFPGSRIDPPEWCDRTATRWDEHDEPWCELHGSQPDPFDGQDI